MFSFLSRIHRLKKDGVVGPRVEVNDKGYKIRIITRGEELFYMDGKKALIADICLSPPCIFSFSIKKWDNGKIISDDEKKVILQRIISYFKKYQECDIEVTDIKPTNN
jgi:hypothetical protein